MSVWNPLPLHHPLYAPLASLTLPDSLSDWPDQPALDALIQLNPGRSKGRLRFMLDLEPDDYYEIHIGNTGEVPTRSGNWHDWFNALAWLAWPKTKAALNARHLRAISRGEARRGPHRDAATLLDECGIVVATSNPSLGEALDSMQWNRLFLTHRQEWGRQIGAHALGHALFETGLAPFIGWCGKALLVSVAEDFFNKEPAQQRDWLDNWLAEQLGNDDWLASPRALCPLPLLGIPGWWPANEDPAFYANQDYFRSSRRAKSSTVTA